MSPRSPIVRRVRPVWAEVPAGGLTYLLVKRLKVGPGLSTGGKSRRI